MARTSVRAAVPVFAVVFPTVVGGGSVYPAVENLLLAARSVARLVQALPVSRSTPRCLPVATLRVQSRRKAPLAGKQLSALLTGPRCSPPLMLLPIISCPVSVNCLVAEPHIPVAGLSPAL